MREAVLEPDEKTDFTYELCALNPGTSENIKHSTPNIQTPRRLRYFDVES
jgi:hypothetical protein